MAGSRWFKRHKKGIFIIMLLLAAVFFIFGAKIWLYLNFLLGNDIVIKLTADNEYITLSKDEQKELSFKISVTTNPFCSAECKSIFEDISQNYFVDEDSFIIRPGFSKEKDFQIKTQKPGEGIEIYRFNVDCSSKNTVLCHTSQEPTSRSILIFVERKLTQEESEIKQYLKTALPKISDEIAKDNELFLYLNISFEKLSYFFDFSELKLLKGTEQILREATEAIAQIEKLWKTQEFYSINKSISELSEKTAQLSKNLNDSEKIIEGYADSYNAMLQSLDESSQTIIKAKNISYTNTTFIRSLNENIANFNELFNNFNKKSALLEKENLVSQKSDEIKNSIALLKNSSQKELLYYNLQTSLDYVLLCDIAKACFAYNAIEEISKEDSFNAEQTCSVMNEQKLRFIDINKTLNITQYPAEKEFWSNISLIFQKIKNDKKQEFLNSLSLNSTNYKALKEMLSFNQTSYPEYPLMNLTSALAYSLIQDQKPCSLANISFEKLLPINILKIEKSNFSFEKKEFVFDDPLPQCCVFGKCLDCCASIACRTNKSLYPIIIVHGHAFNKDIAADYSLDSFNKLQNKLEEDGYLSAGAISLYTPTKESGTAWSILPVPVSLKVSYYYDFFKQPENYVIIQTKSENIDTYALRLKDLIDKVTSKTNKKKVIIIAHSMGGLVSRRYLQIFGNSSVEQLIMIGTPNNGIAGSTLDYCSLIGEQLECRDMSSDSLFLNKLNNGQTIFVPTTNIIGSGCSMDLGDGDGTVLVEKAWLEGAQNYIINGTCSSIDKPLHMQMLDVYSYPEVYNIIKGSILMR